MAHRPSATLAVISIAAAAVAPALAFAAKKGASPSAKRGEYLVNFGGCHDCHTPHRFDESLGLPVPDMSRALMGHPRDAPDPQGKGGPQDIGVIGPTFTSFALPFGVVYSANLTSDPTTGIGEWSEKFFVEAMRTGRHGSRPILPPMPWPSLAALTDEDLKAIFAYLKTVPPVKNAVPEPKVPPEAMKGILAGYDKLLVQVKAQQSAAR